MKREIRAVRRGNRTVIYGIGLSGFFGFLRWVKFGEIKFAEDLGNTFFVPSWNLITLSEQLVDVVNKEMIYLRGKIISTKNFWRK